MIVAGIVERSDRVPGASIALRFVFMLEHFAFGGSFCRRGSHGALGHGVVFLQVSG